jgi:hypothetical protein
LAKAARKPTHHSPAAAPGRSSPAGTSQRPAVHLKKEELQKVDALRVNIAAGSAQHKPDVQSTFELMYLRVLSRIKNRGPLEEDLKELKKMLDHAAAKMDEVIEKADRQNAS